MAGKKNNAVVAVMTDMTERQAADLTREIIRAKQRIAPYGRGTIAQGKKGDVGRLLGGEQKRLKGGE